MAILKLEEMHGIDIGNAHRNDVSCGEFMDGGGKDMRISLSQKLKNAIYSAFYLAMQPIILQKIMNVFTCCCSILTPQRKGSVTEWK